MKKQRIIIAILSVSILLITSALLFVNTYLLYMEAEKAQKTAFTGDVLIAGKEIVNKVNSMINLAQDSSSLSHNTIADSNDYYIKHSFLYLPEEQERPFALLKETMRDYLGSPIVMNADTTYLINLDSLNSDSLQIIQIKQKDSIRIENLSNIIYNSINRDTLEHLISGVLEKHLIETNFDFCIYEYQNNRYVIAPANNTTNMLENGYVFALKQANNEIFSHYLIISFPYQRTLFLWRMGKIVIPIIILLFMILFIATSTIVSLYRQKKNQEIKNDFVNNMTHEFKTPISTIALACESLSDSSIQLDPTTRAMYISIIESENNRLKTMVGDILQLAQLKKGQVCMKMSLINIHDILTSVIQNISLQVSSAGGKITTHYDAAYFEVFADPFHIENIMINVIENGIKYSNSEPIIDISTYNEKDMLVVVITDHGVGIAKKNIHKIFDEFYRVPKPNANVYETKGYGLGLNYVKKIIELHNGKILVQSELKRGTSFKIYLPLKK